MSNNVTVKDSAGTDRIMKTTETSSVHVSHHNIDVIATGANLIGKVTIRNAANGADIDPLSESTFTGRIGEVQSSPTSFTVLARLKDLLTGISLAAGTAVIGATTYNGVQWSPTRTYTASSNITTAAAITANPASGQKIFLDDLLVSTDTALALDIEMETSGNVLAKFYLAANTTITISPRNGIKADAADKRLMAKTSTTGNIAITALYHSEV